VTLADEPMEAGLHQIVWPGKNARGARVPCGFYCLRLESAGRKANARIMVLR
jgi:hypothetical protein